MYYLLFLFASLSRQQELPAEAAEQPISPAPCRIMPQPIEDVVPECYPGGLARTVVPGVWPVSLFSLLRHASVLLSVVMLQPEHVFCFPFACKIIKTLRNPAVKAGKSVFLQPICDNRRGYAEMDRLYMVCR